MKRLCNYLHTHLLPIFASMIMGISLMSCASLTHQYSVSISRPNANQKGYYSKFAKEYISGGPSYVYSLAEISKDPLDIEPTNGFILFVSEDLSTVYPATKVLTQADDPNYLRNNTNGSNAYFGRTTEQEIAYAVRFSGLWESLHKIKKDEYKRDYANIRTLDQAKEFLASYRNYDPESLVPLVRSRIPQLEREQKVADEKSMHIKYLNDYDSIGSAESADSFIDKYTKYDPDNLVKRAEEKLLQYQIQDREKAKAEAAERARAEQARLQALALQQKEMAEEAERARVQAKQHDQEITSTKDVYPGWKSTNANETLKVYIDTGYIGINSGVWMKFLRIQSLQDNLTIYNVVLNRGNCRNEPGFKRNLRFAEVSSLVLQSGSVTWCDILEATIDTSYGKYTYRFDDGYATLQ